MAAQQFTNLVDMYRSAVDRFAANPLFGERDENGTWRWMTYAQFGDAVDDARGGLAGLGVGEGDRVAVISDNRVAWAVGAYATYGLGAMWVPMYEAQQSKEWGYILNDCGAMVAVVADDGIRAILDEHRADLPALKHIVVIEGTADGEAITWQELLAEGSAKPVDPISPYEDTLTGLIYTSGTTGNPKGVMLSHRNLASNVQALNEVFPLDPEDRSVAFLPWAHSFGQTVELHTIISQGASTAISSSKTLQQDMPEVKPTMLVSVPTMFNKIYDALNKLMAEEGGAKKAIFDRAMANARTREDMLKRGKTTRWVELQHSLYDRLVFSKVRERLGGSVKYAFSGGAAISTEVAEFISAVGITVYEGYGLTETAPVVTANVRGARRIGSVGRPVPGVRVDIDTHVTAEDGGIGEIVVYGPNVMEGYYNLPEENAKVFTEDGGFRTGDLGSIDADGYLFIRGRIKEQYKLENGKYVVPAPIEEQLTLSGFITSAMVYGEQKPYNVALLVLDEEAVRNWAKHQGLEISDYETFIQGAEVRGLIQSELDRLQADVKRYEQVRDFHVASDEWTPENGMLTPSLKVKRRAVLAEYGDDIRSLYAAD